MTVSLMIKRLMMKLLPLILIVSQTSHEYDSMMDHNVSNDLKLIVS